MPDSISTLALRVDSQSAISNLNKFGAAATALGGTTDALRGKIVQLGAAFLSVNFAKRLVSEAAEGQEAFGKYTQVLGRYKDQADKLVTELRSSFNFDTTSAQQSIATMTDLFTKSGVELKQAFEFTSDLQKRAADIEAFTNAEGGVAAVSDSLTRGIIGNQIALRRLGIVLNDDMLKTQMAEDRKKGLTFATANAAKMHARYALIMKQSSSAAGQVARESDNFANRLRKLRAVSADLRNELGDIVIPVATKFVTAAERITRSLEGASDRTKAFVVAGGATLGILTALSPWILKLAAGITTYRAAKKQATIEEEANNIASQQTTASKEREAAARLANAQAIQAENIALGAQNRSSVGATFNSPILSKAEKRAAKMAWRSQTEGARKFSQLAGAMPATLGKSAATKTLGGVGAFANLAPLFGKLTAPISKLNSVLGKTFSTIASKIPLITKFSGVFGKCLGAFGTAGAVVGGVFLTLQAFKNAPQFLEKLLDGIVPKVKEFAANIPEMLSSGIKAGFSMLGAGVNAAKKLGVDALLGAGQTIKRLAGYETAASREYKLNKQIEANNRKRQELLEAQQKQLAAENMVLEAQKSAEQARTSAEMKLNATRETESVKLEKATRERDEKQREIIANEDRLAQLQARLASKNLTNDERAQIEEDAKTTSETLSTANEEWLKLAEEVEKVSDAVHSAARSFAEDQRIFEKAQKDSELEFQNATLQMELGNASSFNARRAAMMAGINKAKEDLDASNAAIGEANELNDQIKTVREQLTSAIVSRALTDLQELAESGDLSGDAAIIFAGASNALEKAGYELGDLTFRKGSAKQLLEQMTERQKAQGEELEDLMRARDEKQALAGERGSRLEAYNSANKAYEELEKTRKETLDNEKRTEEERLRQQARANASFQRGIGDTYFARQLSAVDLLYGEDKLGAAQARYNLIGGRGVNDWNQALESLEAQQREISNLTGRLTLLDWKNLEGTLTDDEAKQRDQLRSQIETLRNEYDSDYQSSIQKRLATEEELLGLENSMREEYLAEAQKWIDETTNTWKDQLTAQAKENEEAQRRRLEERSKVEEEARMAVSGSRAITSGSSEAFNIASRIYDRGRENLPTEKKIENSTKQIENIVKTMQEQMMSYFREQTMNGMTLSMGY